MNGKYIEWKQLWTLFDKLSAMAAASCGISILPKLKLEHLKLTSFSRMRVDLAAQVGFNLPIIIITVLPLATQFAGVKPKCC